MTRKHLMLAAVLVGAGTLGIAGLASAATAAKPDSLAAAIATKFHLKQADVQAVINEHHTEMQGFREGQYEDRLTKAVTEGKLTADQKSKLLAKHQELMSFMTTLKDKTPAERRTALDQKRAELEAWEQANNIPAGYLGGMGHGMMGHGIGRHGGLDDHGSHDSADQS